MAHESLIREGRKALRQNIGPEEVRIYFLKKGMDKKEANKAIKEIQAEKLIKDSRKAAIEKKLRINAQNAESSRIQKKPSSFWLYMLILLIIVLIVYMISREKLSLGTFIIKNFK
ncbi:MAG: hypothetical protein AABX33_05010 [Nanoarchaeota archaeon]